ncbi:MAG: hypothetical protein NW226_22015 [Microscillaceae bacterium]|nr:hypothetical protein [Microscillaceae bacterium]
MKVYESKYSRIIYSQDTLTLEWIWASDNEQIKPADLKNEVKKFIKIIHTNICNKILLDTWYFCFCLDLEIQDWIQMRFDQTIQQSALQKIAVVKSREVLSQICIEQLLYEQFPDFVEKKFFYNSFEAREWLKK